MADTKFTKGEWCADRSKVWAFFRGESAFGKFPVADCYGARGVTQLERNANAHLIAAAPELYEALREAQEVIAVCLPAYEGVLGKISKALAKAEGVQRG